MFKFKSETMLIFIIILLYRVIDTDISLHISQSVVVDVLTQFEETDNSNSHFKNIKCTFSIIFISWSCIIEIELSTFIIPPHLVYKFSFIEKHPDCIQFGMSSV